MFNGMIPQSANRTHYKKGNIDMPGENNHGKPATLEIWSCYQSAGYKTNYEHVPVCYLILTVDNEIVWRKRYSGKNIKYCHSTYEDCAEAVT